MYHRLSEKEILVDQMQAKIEQLNAQVKALQNQGDKEVNNTIAI